MLVEKIMTKNVYTVMPTMKVVAAIELTRKYGIRHLPVVDEQGQLTGIVTERDLKMVEYLARETNQSINEKVINEIMVTPVHTAHSLDPIDDAARQLTEHKIGCLPVVQSGKVVGIVTESDVLRWMMELLGVNRPGTHMEVEIPDKPGVLAEIAGIMSSHRVNIIGVYLMPFRKPGRKSLVFRIETPDPTLVIADVISAGYNVVWPEID